MKLFGMDIRRDRPQPALRAEPPVVAAAGVGGTRDPSPWMQEIGWGGGAPVSRHLPRVTPNRAEQHATVFACCNNIAGDLSKVPLKLYQRDADGQETRVRDHPAAYLLNIEAAPGIAAQVARYALIYAYALRGNSYAYGPRDGGGELMMIDLVSQDRCGILKAGRGRFYEFEDGAGIQRRVPGRSMIHLRYGASDGWTGRSPLEAASESVGLAMAGQAAAARTASGGTTKAVIKLDDVYDSDEDRERNARRVKEQITRPDADGMPVLGPNEDIKSLDLSAADQELLASRKYDREQLAAIYRMPPSKLQMLEYGVKANGEQQAIDYLTDCLLHWSVLVESQLMLAILTEKERRAGFYLRHDFGALLQPTTKDRNEALVKAIGGPFLTPNEGRKIVGERPVKGGDDLNPAPNMTRDAAASEEEDA